MVARQLVAQAAVSLILMCGAGCESKVPAPQLTETDANPFCTFNLIREDGLSVGRDWEFATSETEEACLAILPNADFPKSWNGSQVHIPQLWLTRFVCFPKYSSAASTDAVGFGCDPWFSAMTSGTPPPTFTTEGPHYPPNAADRCPQNRPLGPVRDGVAYWRTPKQKGALEFWVILGSPFQDPGEYVYELQMYPAWKAEVGAYVGYKLGEPVILRRGLLTVRESSGESPSP